MSEVGTFVRVGKRWLVRTNKRVLVGEEVIVQKKDQTHITMTVVGLSDRRFSYHFAPAAELGSNAAERARARAAGKGKGWFNRRPTRSKQQRPPGPVDRPLVRPTRCVGGMTIEQARADARGRGRAWTPYHCEKCHEWHVSEE